MSFSLNKACKKRKRCPKIFRFNSFADPGCPPITPSGTFRDKVRFFLQEAGELEHYKVFGNPIWLTLLIHENTNLMVPLYTIEEDVNQSSHPFCDRCRSLGWGGHFVTKRRYHFIIPVDNWWHKSLSEGALDNQNHHLLHGVIHCNGYGHLLCINGVEGGSKILSGREIMDIWDKICINLRARKIGVEDASYKRSMDLRLLHGVAYGHSWFGRWGYRFFRGSFGVTEQKYFEAIEALATLELENIVKDFSKTNCLLHKEIKQMIRYYTDMSEAQIITIRDLLKFMLTIRSRSRAPVSKITDSSSSAAPPIKEKSAARYKKFSCIDSRWPTRRLEFAAQVIVDALKENKDSKSGSCGMTRQEVRDAARIHIGDTGLLDYVLKSLNNVIVGNFVVRRKVNPSTRVLEYTIHELGNGFKALEPPEVMAAVESSWVLGNDIYSDVLYLYKNVLLGYPTDSEPMDLVAQTILDSRHFMKERALRDEMEQHVLTFICHLKLNFMDTKSELGEIVMVPLHATVGDLKLAIEAALRDTYCIAEGLIVTEIEELMDVGDEEVLFELINSGMELSVRGIAMDLCTPLKYQRGPGNWKVRCECGACDDDGERMMACDICEVWQHTRCCGIDDLETVPPLFMCSSCCDSLVLPRTESGFSVDCVDDFLIPIEPSHLL